VVFEKSTLNHHPPNLSSNGPTQPNLLLWQVGSHLCVLLMMQLYG